MAIVEHLPNYGVHFYDVKDKSNASWYLGISFKGIAVYENNDRKVPRKVCLKRKGCFSYINENF
jgi:hypothetical protein